MLNVRFADGCVAAEVFARHPAREDDAIGLLQRGLQVTGYRRQRQHVEDVGVGPIETWFVELHILMPQARAAECAGQARERLYLRKIDLHLVRNPATNILGRVRSLAGKIQRHRDPVGLLVTWDEAVERQLVAHEESDEQRRGEANGEPDDVDRGVEPVPREFAQRCREIVTQHRIESGYGGRGPR